MPAPKGNKHAAKRGVSQLVRIRLDDPRDFDFIHEALIPEERGAALLAAANKLAADSLVIVADCAICDDAITQADERIYWNGKLICYSCEQIALSQASK